jgi:SAM-dependent methyltransferase
MVTKLRWDSAQTYEKGYWETEASRIKQGLSDGLSWYEWRADNLMGFLMESLKDIVLDLDKSTVLEVGSGPVGIVSFLNASRKVAVDPLADYYGTAVELSKHRSPDVEYLATKGEELPFEKDLFDLVIIDNVIDHVLNAEAVMSEIIRVLKPGGVLYLTVNLHPVAGAWLHRLASTLQIDRGHPHTFTLKRIRLMLESYGLSIKGEQWGSYISSWWNDLNSKTMKTKLKALAGLSEYLYSSISTKNVIIQHLFQ